MKQLRNYGVYELPRVERRLLLISHSRGISLLYDSKLRTAIPARFEITSNGQLINWHKEAMNWTVDDLFDTGETLIP